jgi:hypothetical protein
MCTHDQSSWRQSTAGEVFRKPLTPGNDDVIDMGLVTARSNQHQLGRYHPVGVPMAWRHLVRPPQVMQRDVAGY